MKKTIWSAIIFLFVIVFGSNFTEASTRWQAMLPLDPKEWTVLVYLDGDCNLESLQIQAFGFMASAGSTADVNIVVQFDRIPGYDTHYGDWTDCKRFYITAGMTPTADNALYSLGEINLGDPAILVDFIIWGITAYPAKKYAVILSDHGDNTGVCDDWTSYDYLSCWELYDAMEIVRESTGVTVDLIGFEACVMAAAEVAFHVREGAKVMVASEEKCDDWPYDDILSELGTSPTMNATTLAQRVVHHYMLRYDNSPQHQKAALSAFNLTMVDSEVFPAIEALVNRLNHTLATYCHTILKALSKGDYPFDWSGYGGDLFHFSQTIKSFVPDLQVQTAAQAVMDAIDVARIAEWHDSDHPNFHGLSLFLPPTTEAYLSRVRDYGGNYYWLENSTWDDFLQALFVTYGPGIVSRESLSDVSFALFDSNADDHLDAVHVRLDADTTGEALNVSVHGYLINSSGHVVDADMAWTQASTQDKWCNLSLHIPAGAAEDWYDVKLLLYDEYGVYEDSLYSDHVAYLPEAMQHDVAVNDVSVFQRVVGQGFPVQINVTVANKGHYPETFNVTTYANGTAINSTRLIAQSRRSITFTFCWNTTSVMKGNHTIHVEVTPVSGETNLTDNTLVAPENICVTIPGDVDGDKNVDIYDIVLMSDAYGSVLGDGEFVHNCDIDGDGDIDIYDIVIAAGNYGKSW